MILPIDTIIKYQSATLEFVRDCPLQNAPKILIIEINPLAFRYTSRKNFYLQLCLTKIL